MTLLLIASLLAAAPAPPEPETTWYGWQTLLTDAASVGLSMATAAHGNADGKSTALGLTSAAFYFLGGPAVHLARGRGKTALADLGLRIGIPLGAGLLAGVIVGASASSNSDCPGCVYEAGFLFGAVIGGVVASGVDAVKLAREPVAARSIAPSVGWIQGRDGVRHPSFGLAATF